MHGPPILQKSPVDSRVRWTAHEGVDAALTPTSLPDFFCWSKFGDEAGESADGILARKESEREANDGLFLWGIGSSIAPSLQELLRLDSNPRILFTPMLSAPARHDTNPGAIAVWHAAQTMDGSPYVLPPHSLVTSRADAERPPRRHYALICRRDASLTERASRLWLDDADVRNLRTGSHVGSSQVTSVVRLVDEDQRGDPRYQVAFAAELEPPYFVTLSNCTVLGHQVEGLASSA